MTLNFILFTLYSWCEEIHEFACVVDLSGEFDWVVSFVFDVDFVVSYAFDDFGEILIRNSAERLTQFTKQQIAVFRSRHDMSGLEKVSQSVRIVKTQVWIGMLLNVYFHRRSRLNGLAGMCGNRTHPGRD